MEAGTIQSPRPAELAQTYRPNFLLAWLYRIFFAKIDVDPVWIRAVREAAQRGTVVYVMRSVSYLDFVALDFFLKRYSLPLIRFVMNLGLWVLEPFGRGLRRLFTAREPEARALERVVSAGQSALLFMRKPQAPTAFKRRGDRADVDHIKVLIEQQRRQATPILLVPQVIVFGKRPDALYKGVVDQIFGPREYPGRLRVLAQLFWHFGNAKLRACEPLDLSALLAEHPDLDDEALINKIHWLLVTRLDRERRVVLGPVAKSADRLKQEILRHPRIREAMADSARRDKKDPHAIELQVRRDLDRLAARPNPVVLTWVDRLMDWVFHRIYQGVELDLAGLQRVREEARRGPVVLLPSHKSHVDYILLSYVFFRNGLQCPLIAAGDNLAFWPAGPLLRWCGAFFIRRSFKGARLYTTLVDTYVRKILKEGYALEFFIEGGRSRTGKLLPPKAGLLTMVADAAEAAGVDVAYVPISIGYEKIVEQRSYVDELSGAEKKKEDAGALLRAPRILTTTYGRAYVQFGEVLRFAPSAAAALPAGASRAIAADEGGEEASAGGGGGAEESREAAAARRREKRAAFTRMQARRGEVQGLAMRAIYEINRVTPVTPTALVSTVLLSVQRRGIAREDLLARVDALVFDLEKHGAHFASTLAVDYRGGRRPYRVDAIDQAIHLFTEGGLLTVHGPADDAVYQVPDDKRLALDYYKNNLIHFFVPRALLATALRAAAHRGAATSSAPLPLEAVVIPRAELRAGVDALAKVFKHEFSFRAEADAEFDAALARAVEEGDVAVVPAAGEGGVEMVRVVDEHAADRLAFQAGLIRNFVESYRVAARALDALRKAPLPTRELVKRGMDVGERMYLTGEIAQREAISKPVLENAFASFREAGYLLGGEGGPQRLAAGHESEAAVRAIEAELARYL